MSSVFPIRRRPVITVKQAVFETAVLSAKEPVFHFFFLLTPSTHLLQPCSICFQDTYAVHFRLCGKDSLKVTLMWCGDSLGLCR